MKKLLVISFFCLFCTHTVFAKIYQVGEKILNNKIEIDKISIELTEGDWFVARRDEAHYGWLTQFIFGFIRIEDGEIMEVIDIYDGDMGSSFMAYIDQEIHRITFKDPYDGCYQRPEYFLLEYYKSGKVHNCFVVRHWDFMKELYNPDDAHTKINSVDYRRFLDENSFKIPKITLTSWHSYFSRHNRSNWYQVFHVINTKALNAPKNKYLTEETSEYHKYNIEKYPQHQKAMNEWISISAQFHKKFEILNNAKKHHKLELDKYIITTKNSQPTKDIVTNLKKLNDLYKSGVLSKEEFEKAKTKILSQ